MNFFYYIALLNVCIFFSFELNIIVLLFEICLILAILDIFLLQTKHKNNCNHYKL